MSSNPFNPMFQTQYQNVSVSRNLDQIQKLRQMAAQGQEVYNLAFGQSPFPVPKVAQESLKKHAHSNLYEAVQGVECLREKIVNLHGYGHLSAEDCIVTPGCKEASWLLMHVLSEKMPVFLCSPTWVAYESQVISAKKNLYWIDTKMSENYKITAEAVDNAVQKAKSEGNFDTDGNLPEFKGLVILVEPCNPSGRCHTDQELKNLGQIFKKHKLIVLSDEIYSLLDYDHKILPLSDRKKGLADFYPEGTIVSGGFSKWASLGGWRIGYNIYPKPLNEVLKRVKAAASFSYSCVTSPVQYACHDLLVSVYEDGEAGFLFKASVILCCLSEYVKEKLEKIGVPCTKSQSGFYLVPDFEKLRGKGKDKSKDQGFQTGTQLTDQLLADTGISMVEAGPCFGRPNNELTTRLCYIDLDGEKSLVEFDSFRPLDGDYLKYTPREYLHKFYAGRYDDFLGQVAPKMVVCIDKLVAWVEKF